MAVSTVTAVSYRVEHITHYEYTAPVTLSQQLLHLTPRNLPWQQCETHALKIDPQAAEYIERRDFFGNRIAQFAVQPAMSSALITNALTVDVEDYFQVSAFAPYIARADWDRRECRVERNVDRILALLDEHETEATFFTLGWIAERYPQLVRRIAEQGHEIASHGYGHERASDLSRQAFRADIERAKAVLEDLSGHEVQ